MTQRNYLINTTTISQTASGTTIGSGNTQSSSFVTALTLVRTSIGAGEFLSGSQTWAIHYVVSAMATPYEMRLSLQRRNSSGTPQVTIGPGTTRSATGTYDDSIVGDLGTWAANDQLALVWEHRRPSGTGNKSGTVDANGSSYIDAPANANVSVALTGVSSTLSAGSLGATHDQPLTGVSTTGAAGTVTPIIDFPPLTIPGYQFCKGGDGLSVNMERIR